jgi:peptidoglycan hydrolase CwlO-like protein
MIRSKFALPLLAAMALMTATSADAGNDPTAGGGAAPAGDKPAEKTPGVGDLAKKLIREGKGNKEVLEAVKAAFPDAKTTMSSINWYRNNLRSLGEDVKTAREISQAGKPTKEERDAAKAKAKQEKKDAAAKAKAEKKAEKDAAKAQAKADAKAAKDAAKASEKPAEASNAGAGEQTASADAMLA